MVIHIGASSLQLERYQGQDWSIETGDLEDRF